MNNVLIINGHQRYDQIAEGKLTKLFIDTASDFFTENGLNVKYSVIESDYDVSNELKKLAWADYILFQYPVYWMG
ncbi:MAG: flavodoxin family protein, partial [Sulfurovum sp.]|nr:NAD(P)H-dependent oxidoreductase [Sulfurovum sp.]NNJ45848.1 flavodoxin family protein [Sulfurovum sp.]